MRQSFYISIKGINEDEVQQELGQFMNDLNEKYKDKGFWCNRFRNDQRSSRTCRKLFKRMTKYEKKNRQQLQRSEKGMKGRFLIQTIKKNARPDIVKMFNSAGDAKDWENYAHSYDTYERAKRECEALIQYGSYKANEVRVIEVVGTFSSEIKVSAKSEKYS